MSMPRKIAYVVGGIVGLSIIVGMITGSVNVVGGLIFLALYAAVAYGAVRINEREQKSSENTWSGSGPKPGSVGGPKKE